MTTQKNSPTESRTCQKRPRSRYSKPWLPNQPELARQAVDAGQLADEAPEDDDASAPSSP